MSKSAVETKTIKVDSLEMTGTKNTLGMKLDGQELNTDDIRSFKIEGSVSEPITLTIEEWI